jgi:hypothetical protein
MCYLVRQQQPEEERAGTPPLSSPERLRPRLIGAGAAALIGSLAVAAALVVPPPKPPVSEAKSVGAAAPAAVKSMPSNPGVNVTAEGGIERISMPGDDEVPTRSDFVKSGLSHCDHDL